MGYRNLNRLIIAFLFIINLIALLYAISNLSISYNEALIFYEKDSLISYIANFFTMIFGQNDYALRIPFVIIYFINSLLVYKISKKILKRKIDQIFSLILFMMLPGVMSSATLLNSASIIILMTLFCIYFDQNNNKFLFFLTLILSFFISKAFLVLYISVFIYGFFYKKSDYEIVSFCLLLLSLIFYDYEISGKPRGFFLDTIGIFSATYSLFVFLIFIYAMYRILIKEKKDLIFFISFIPFIYCLIFSIRQRIELENFLPFCVVSVPLIIKIFFHSYRIRLKRFRKFHKIIFLLSTLFLFFNYLLTIFNQSLYIFFKNNPKKHFIYKYDIAKELAQKLKKNSINNISSFDYKMLLRLRFYGIQSGNDYFLYSDDVFFANKKITIKKYDIIIASYFIFKEGT